MRAFSYSDARARYAELLEAVINDREEVVITRSGRDPVVIVPLDEYESMKETLRLFRSPANARRLVASIERLESRSATMPRRKRARRAR